MRSDRTIQEQFEEFHAKHPEVFEKIVELARGVKARGHRQYSVYALFNIVRWHFDMEHDAEEDFKLNNNYQPFYARKIMAEVPDLAGFFETRQLLRKAA